MTEILLEFKGRARAYWTKFSGKNRQHCSANEPYFCEQFNTNYTHQFRAKAKSDGKKVCFDWIFEVYCFVKKNNSIVMSFVYVHLKFEEMVSTTITRSKQYIYR